MTRRATVGIHRGGYAFTRAKRAMFARYGDTCHLCGHPGARQADHLNPLAFDPEQPVDPDMMRPAHGGSNAAHDNPCPTCGRRCNQERGTRTDFAIFTPVMSW